MTYILTSIYCISGPWTGLPDGKKHLLRVRVHQGYKALSLTPRQGGKDEALHQLTY